MRLNPFPAYAVASLEADASRDDELTVKTPGIVKAEGLVDLLLDQYPEQPSPDDFPRGLNLSVMGEFGAGKTHLLGHVERYLRSVCADRDLTPGVISVGAMETRPVDWHRGAIGPSLAALDLESLATDLYAKAARAVALRAPLTSAAAAQIDKDPANVRLLVQADLLSSTSVELEMSATLERIAPGTDPQVLAAIEGLVWDPRPSLRWLEGERLSKREATASGLMEPLASDRLAGDVLVAVAAIHRSLGRPFLLLIDELEHLVRFDERVGGKANITWLKRLLERLERCGAMVVVAGHLSAWEGHPDYLERFSPAAAIELAPLRAEHVMEVVEHFEGDRGCFTIADADLVARAAAGRIRGILGILHELHERSGGFDRPLPGGAIGEVAGAKPRLVDPEEAIAALDRLLVELNLTVSRKTTIGGLVFDLIAFRDGAPAVVIEVKQALFGKKQQEQAQRFLDKVRAVTRDAPASVGIFASAGTLDAGLLELDPSSARVFWFDLTQPDFIADVRRSLEPALHQTSAPSDPPSEGPARDAALAALVDEIQSVKEAQAADYARLEERLAAPAEDASELKFQAPTQQETQDDRRAIFEDLSGRPPLLRQLGLMWGPMLLLVAVLLVGGIGLIAQAGPIADAWSYEGGEPGVQVSIYFAGITMILASAFILFRQFLLLDRFYTFKKERLRDVYVLDGPIKDLVETNRIIDSALDRSINPRFASRNALQMLADGGLLHHIREDEL